MSHWTKCNFSPTDKDCHQEFQDLQGKDFSTVLENVTEVFSLLQKYSFYNIPYFRITPKMDNHHIL